MAGLKRTIAISDKVREATTALTARDGKTCLQKLDEIATIDASMASSYDMYRGQCEMISGRCEQGLRRLKATKLYAEQALEHFKTTYCPASSLSSPKDRLKAIWLQAGTGKTAEQCRAFESQLTQVLASFGSEKPDATAVGGAWSTIGSCWVNAGDCTEARRIAGKTVPADKLDAYMENWLGSARDRLCKK
jgi:hypothetical protein